MWRTLDPLFFFALGMFRLSHLSMPPPSLDPGLLYGAGAMGQQSDPGFAEKGEDNLRQTLVWFFLQ